MRVLIVGTGGREHAIAKALHRSKHDIEIYAVGGWVNPGITGLGTVDVIDINNSEIVVEYALEQQIEIAIIGSENQLEQGLANTLAAAGVFCIGPGSSLARLETDKVYARELINELYNPRYKVFSNNYSSNALREWIKDLGGNYVVKAVGLKGGKGVKVSDVHLTSFEEADQYCRELVDEDGRVLVEERLFGEEFTVQAFTDGKHVINMPIVKDFKCLQDGDLGPNTGGMGCVSFEDGHIPFLTEKDIETAHRINKEVLTSITANDKRYVGILYGSFMKTTTSVKVIEYNCRFGDPEAINVLELLETDFVDILLAMRDSTLDRMTVVWSNDAMVTNYIVAPGYPDTPQRVDTFVPFSTNVIYAKIVNRGERHLRNYTQLASRSFAVWSRGTTMETAFERNSKLLDLIDKDHCHYRTDIGKQWTKPANVYKRSGVNVVEGERVVSNIRECVTSTWNKNVVSKFGDFAGMYDLNGNLLVTSTDGVGTKTIATLQAMGTDRGFYSLGQDIVNHCVNDILVKGAEPLFFLDYIASSKLCAEHVTQFVQGASAACKEVGCALIGGETAEMPDVYNTGHIDIVGTIVGVVKPNEIIDGPSCIEERDLVYGLRSNGPHTNGYSLIRKVIPDLREEDVAPHTCYLHNIRQIRDVGIKIKGLCHITGGGWWGNIKRVLPPGMAIDVSIPRVSNDSVFARVQEAANISDKEMLDIFNMGFGMLVIVDPEDWLYFEGLRCGLLLGTVTKQSKPNIRIV